MARRPFNGPVVITTEYGAPQPWSRRGYHTGVDYALSVGTPLLAPESGTIVTNGDGRGETDGRGYYIVLQGDSGTFHQFFHLQHLGTATGRVAEGGTIGFTGNTGRSIGPHLHWETTRANDRNSDFAPGSWLFKDQPVYVPPVTVLKNYVRIFGDYRTFYRTAGSGQLGKLAPNKYGGHLDYEIQHRVGSYLKIHSQTFGPGYIYAGPDIAHLTQYYRA